MLGDEYLDNDFDDDMDDDDQANFVPVIAEKNVPKSYQVEFAVYSPVDIGSFQAKEMAHVSGILGCDVSIAGTLLRHFKWNKEKLIESFMDDADKVSSAAGVVMSSEKPAFIVLPGFVCALCCDDDPTLETLSLLCSHRYCRNCYDTYLTMKIKEGQSTITCPSTCKLIVDSVTIQMVVSSDIYSKYQNHLVNAYVQEHSNLKFCPAPGCEYAVDCKVSSSQLKSVVPTVQCKCGQSFCFGCGLEDHQPSICSLVKLWIKKCADDSETANWMLANTKECAKCHSSIEKNGGCNHMTCRKCRYEFCWICMSNWKDHGGNAYNCNRYVETTGANALDAQSRSRAALERYLHYYNRYTNHVQSAKLDKQLYERTQKKMDQMQKTSEFSWIEVQFLRKATDTLLKARGTLKWTYAFAFYLSKNNQTALFEDNQGDLEIAVEQLSEMLEKPIDPSKVTELKQAVLDKTVYVTSRLEILLTDTATGLKESRWLYNADI